MKLLLQTDELWSSPSAGSSGEHAISIRYRPSKLQALRSPTGKATLITMALTTLLNLALSHDWSSHSAPELPTWDDEGDE